MPELKLKPSTEEDEYDHVERMLRSNGCWQTHLELSDCMGKANDWRKCQNEVQKLKECMEKALIQKHAKVADQKPTK